MNPILAGTLAGSFSQVDDPHSPHGRRHELLDIISITICSVICGAERWADVELFGKCKYDWLKGVSEQTAGQVIAIDGKTLP